MGWGMNPYEEAQLVIEAQKQESPGYLLFCTYVGN